MSSVDLTAADRTVLYFILERARRERSRATRDLSAMTGSALAESVAAEAEKWQASIDLCARLLGTP
jgi:hypothetical protein